MTDHKQTPEEERAEWKALMAHATHVNVGANRKDCAFCVNRSYATDKRALDVSDRYYASRNIFVD